jgi:hypothetical protein
MMWTAHAPVRARQAAQDPGPFLEFCRYLLSLCPPQIRITIVCGNFGPHLTAAKDSRVRAWAAANKFELA